MPSRRTVLQTMLMASAAAPTLLAAAPALAEQAASLKDAYKGQFRVGAAINTAQINETDSRGDPIIKAQFNSISPENCLKWNSVHHEPDRYDFTQADRYVAFGEKNQMFIVGHVLVWHEQTPDWVFRDKDGNLVDRDTLLARMRDHIATVVGRYKGKVHSWDVVNEPIGDDGAMRPSLWYKIIGEDYVAKAFEYAREADPNALLLYNDYSIEYEAKRKGANALIAKLKAAGVPVTSVGLQGHYTLDSPSLDQLDATIATFGDMGFKVPMTELDVTVLPFPMGQVTADVALHIARNSTLNPYADGLPDAVQQKLAERYADLFRIFRKHRGVVDRVSFWGVTDADNWKNDWPIPSRTDYPLLFDRAGKPKPAFDAVIAAATA